MLDQISAWDEFWHCQIKVINYSCIPIQFRQKARRSCNMGGKFGFGGGFWFWVFRPFPFFVFFFVFSAARKWRGHKDLVGNHKGRFMCLKSWFLFFSFLLVDNSVHYSDIVWSNDLSAYFASPFFRSLIKNFSFSFAFLQSLIRNFLFFFCFLKRIHNLTVNEASF